MVIIRTHVGEKLFFQILDEFGDIWGFLLIEMKWSEATEKSFRIAACALSDELAKPHRVGDAFKSVKASNEQFLQHNAACNLFLLFFLQ